MARVGALAAVGGLFSVAVNVPAAVVYGSTLWGNDAASSLAGARLGHLASTAMGVRLVGRLALLRRRDLRPPPGLTYEEDDPAEVFGGFHLSEGLSAESEAAVRSPTTAE